MHPRTSAAASLEWATHASRGLTDVPLARAAPRWPKPARSRSLALRPADVFDPPPHGGAPRRLGPAAPRGRLGPAASSRRLEDLDIEAATPAPDDDERGAVAPRALRRPRRGATRHAPGARDGRGARAGRRSSSPRREARAARARLSDPARALELATALEALPEQFTMGASRRSGDGAQRPRATADDLRALLDRVERRAAGRMWIGWSVPRELAVEHAALLDEQLADAIVALAQVFALLGADAGADDAPRRLEGPEVLGPSRRRGRPRSDEDERGRGAHGAHARARPRSRARAGRRARRRARAGRRVAARRAAARLDAKLPPRPGFAASSRRSRERRGRSSGVRGYSVLKGPFSGKVGVVHELDGKGGARVMLGLLAVRLEVEQPRPRGRRPGPPAPLELPPEAHPGPVVSLRRTTEGPFRASVFDGA